MSKWKWQELELRGVKFIRLEALEVAIDIMERPRYCDRGKWECHVMDAGFPVNPNPVDHADMFPRLFFDLDRAKAEMEDWLDARKYTPGPIGWVADQERYDSVSVTGSGRDVGKEDG